MKLTRASRRLSTALPFLLTTALPVGAGVLVVDQAGGPGAGFTSIQTAVDAALEGDTILVRDGTYPTFKIDGKSLSVVGDGANVEVNASPAQFAIWTITVENLTVEQRVFVGGVRTDFGVFVSGCAGAVWFDEVHCDASGYAYCNVSGVAGAEVRSSAQVTFTRCTLRGETSGSNSVIYLPISGEGLCAQSSTVQLYDCTLEGGWGAPEGSYLTQPGAAGIQIDTSEVTVVGCTIQGGEGGLAPGPLCTTPHLPGGAGVEFVGGTGTLHSVDSTMVGGVASLEPLCPGQTGPAGPVIAGSGTIELLPGVARHLEANSPVRAGETLTYQIEGVAGEIPVLLLSPVHQPLPLPDLFSVLLVGLPFEDVFVLAPLPASGQTSLSFPVPQMTGGAESLTYYGQAAFLDPALMVWLGAGTTTVLLDASF